MHVWIILFILKQTGPALSNIPLLDKNNNESNNKNKPRQTKTEHKLFFFFKNKKEEILSQCDFVIALKFKKKKTLKNLNKSELSNTTL